MAAKLSENSPWRAGYLAKVNDRYAAFLAGGFPVGGETLQCRVDTDRTNWMELRDDCRTADALGYGGVTLPEPGIRCTSNRFIRPTVAETLQILADLKEWARLGQANHWRLKDLVRDAETRAELSAINVDEGWP